MSDRYDTKGFSESQFEPGSDSTVLKNRLGITSPAEMQRAETMALLQTTEAMVDFFDQNHRFTAQDLCDMHSHWLAGIYPFREGNGRLSRLLAMLMGLQAGLPMLIFDEMEGMRRDRYFAAAQAGMGSDYAPMKDIFSRIIAQSRQEE